MIPCLRRITVCLLLMLPLCVAAEHYIWKHLDTRVGLASSYVKTMAEDGQGFVWIGTEEGLHRWDGYSLLTFNTQNSDISSNEINTLLYIPETDQMYIGTAQDNINVLDLRTRQFHNFQGDDRILSPGIVHLSRAADGGIWITAYSYGVQHYDFVNDEFKNYDSRELEGLYEPNWVVADDGNGSLYVGHVKDGMSIINLRTNTVRNFKHSDADPTSIPSNSVNDICFIVVNLRLYISQAE